MFHLGWVRASQVLGSSSICQSSPGTGRSTRNGFWMVKTVELMMVYDGFWSFMMIIKKNKPIWKEQIIGENQQEFKKKRGINMDKWYEQLYRLTWINCLTVYVVYFKRNVYQVHKNPGGSPTEWFSRDTEQLVIHLCLSPFIERW